MTRISIVELKANLTEVINRIALKKERVLVTRHGKGLAAVVPVEDLAALQTLEDQHDLEEAARALQEFKARGEKSVPIEGICRGRRH